MIKSKIFSYDELELHLNYVLDLVSHGKDNVAAQLQDAIDLYVKNYDFYDAAKIMKQRETSRNKSRAANSTPT